MAWSEPGFVLISGAQLPCHKELKNTLQTSILLWLRIAFHLYKDFFRKMIDHRILFWLCKGETRQHWSWLNGFTQICLSWSRKPPEISWELWNALYTQYFSKLDFWLAANHQKLLPHWKPSESLSSDVLFRHPPAVHLMLLTCFPKRCTQLSWRGVDKENFVCFN